MSQLSPAVIRLLRGVMTLAVPLLLIAGSVRLVMNPLWMRLEYTRSGFPVDVYGFNTENRLEYGLFGINYLLNGEPIDYLGNLRLPVDLCFNPPVGASDCPMFTEGELHHMHDVKGVTQMVYAVALAWAVLTVLAGYVLWQRAPHQVDTALLQGSLLTIALVITVVVIAVTAWDTFFDTFHALFFQSGTWRFYYSDTLIRLYPEQFWFDAALTTGTFITGGALILLSIAWIHLKRTDARP